MKVFLSFVILVIFSSQISAFLPFDYVDIDANLERGDNGKPQKSTDFLGEIEKSLANAKQNFFTILDNFSQVKILKSGTMAIKFTKYILTKKILNIHLIF